VISLLQSRPVASAKHQLYNENNKTKNFLLILSDFSPAPVEPGKFDLVYQNPDGSESVEYAVSRGSWVSCVTSSVTEK